jgi:aspartyl-tRNA(Asn)/glutamyl-tRNA(Gln) amidotransferase subunit C
MISRDDIKKLATLSRMKLSEEDEEKFTKEVDSILGYVAQIQQFKGEDLARGNERVKNALREDANPHESGINTEVILAEAPQREGQYLKVKKIL